MGNILFKLQHMSIVTKTGDQGITSLYSGERVSKGDLRIEAVGTLDELNASLAGLNLEFIQQDVFELGAAVADLRRKEEEDILKSELRFLEKKIIELEPKLPPLTHFILPGGHPLAIQAHRARAICRRAERSLCRLAEQELLPKNTIIYLNRLSDYLFLVARNINFENGIAETLWTSKKVL